LFFLTYISETKDIEPKEVQEMLEKVRIEGGDIMPTLAQRLRDEGRLEGRTEGRTEGIKEGMKEGIKEGILEGIKEGRSEGRKEEKLETARRMLHDNFPIEGIIKYTGLTEREIRALMN
jgi:predicted transposase/invertase (TIGR01784 family)